MQNLLHKISVKAIHQLTRGTTDVIRVTEVLDECNNFVGILNGVDLLAIKHISDSNKILVFSLFRVVNIKWAFELPQYDFGDENTEEEGVVEWLTRGTVEPDEKNTPISAINITEIEKMLGL
jgi:hypothetical protein